MSKIIPSFIDLLAFDAAAKQGTFTRAARDLGVSQPAISRRVAALEAELGVQLFTRESRPLALTENGQRLFDVLHSGLARLEAVIQEIRLQKNERAITVTAGPGFSSFWLIPRLPELCAAFPEYDLRITSGDRAYEAPEGDVHIRFGDGQWVGQESLKILGEEVYAVCSPTCLRGRDAPLGLDVLMRERLLELSDPSDRWYTWPSWFSAAGVRSDERSRTIHFDSYALLIAAALAGHGIALCWSGLLEPYLRSGALVRVSVEAVKSSRGYYATYSKAIQAESPIARLAHFIGSLGASTR